MDSLLLKNVLFEGRETNILSEEGHFKCLDVADGATASTEMDCDGLAIVPALYNAHTHAAMSLVRGYADDMPLQEWLTEHIWPFESNLTREDIRRGSELALKEMKGTGSVMFNDMYFEIEQTIAEVEKSGMRALIGITVMDNHSLSQTRQKQQFIREWKDPTGGRIKLAIAPHAIYTVSAERLRRCTEFARENDMKIHIHLAETKKEVQDCLAEHGMTPVRYLDSLGVLGPDVIAAHCVHVEKEEWDILARRGVTAVNCPCSNMKLGSGRFPYEDAISSGVRIALGTDSSSSNNNLDLREEMKFAALLAKVNGDPTLLPAKEVMKWAGADSASALGVDGGEIAEGKVADCILLDLGNIKMTPCHNLESNWVYAADSSCIKAVICNGKII
ncbi:MAG: amidohydrolase [Bacteroidales bacterium]|nr:amidohydrolase [Bacteroidales bacterium]